MNRNYKKTNKLPMVTTVVAGCNAGADQALATGSLVNNTTALGIEAGQVGVMSYDFHGTVDLGDFIPAGTTAQDVSAIKVIMGTPASKNTLQADPWEAGHKAYVESGVIHAESVRSVSVTKAKPGRLSASSFTDFVPCTSANCDREYKMVVSMDSVRKDTIYGQNQDVITPTFTATPELYNVTDTVDYILQNLLSQLNNRSTAVRLCNGVQGNKEVVGLAINTGGGAGLPIGAIVEGDQIPFYQSKCALQAQPLISTLVADKQMVRALGALLDGYVNSTATAPITAASTIEVIDIETAGSAVNVDSFIVLGLNDDVRLTHPNDPTQGINASTVQVEVTLGEGFEVQSPVDVQVRGEEPFGWGKYLARTFNSRERKFIHTNQSYPSSQHFFGQTYINKDVYYSTMFVDYFDVEDTLTLSEHDPKLLKVITPAFVPVIDVTTVAANIAAHTGSPDTLYDMPSVTTGCESLQVASANFLPTLQSTLEVWLDSTNPKVKGTDSQSTPYLT